MSITKSELRLHIRQKFGYPLVKVELTDDQIDIAIDHARKKYIKWACGNATQEVWFTLLLKSGQRIYDLPTGVIDIISYKDNKNSSFWPGNTSGGINTLFTFDNYVYSHGLKNTLFNMGQFNFVDYKIAKDFLETMEKYNVNKYNWRYHKHKNQLEISPVPGCSNNVTSYTTTALSGQNTLKDHFRYPGSGACNLDSRTINVSGDQWVLIQSYMIEGSTLPLYTPTEDTSGSIYKIDESYAEYLYDIDWIEEYVYAECKMILGNIRRKFQQFSSLGNTGIALDGDQLYSEGKEEVRELEEKLKLEECHEGGWIIMG